jgi:preprotein translocase subunit SecA
MDHLKEGIGLRGYAQQNPLLIYKKEGFDMFHEMIQRMKVETVGILFKVQLAEPASLEEMQKKQDKELVFSGGGDGSPPKKKPVRRGNQKVGRNDPCPCGSGKKFKKCCGR